MNSRAIHRPICFLTLLLGLAACEGRLFAPESGDPPIRTSAHEYVLETTSIGWETEISFLYANRSDGPYYLPNCGGSYFYSLEKRVEDRWVFAWGPVLPLCLSPVIRIDAGTTFAEQRVSNEFRLVIGDAPTGSGPDTGNRFGSES